MSRLTGRCSACSRASILIVTIWVLVFFTLLSTAFYNLFSGRLRLVERLRNRPLAEQAAYSAVELARFEMVTDGGYADSLKEFAGARGKELGPASFTCAVSDEQAKININYAEAAVLARLPGMNMDMAGAIAASKIRPFEAIEELRLVDGISAEAYEGIKGYITVYGDRAVNINTASEAVLAAIGMDPGLVEKVVRFRQGDDLQAATADDMVFHDRGTIVADLEKSIVLTLREKAQLTNLSGLGILGVTSEYCLLEVAVRVVNKPAGMYRIILGKPGIARWEEF